MCRCHPAHGRGFVRMKKERMPISEVVDVNLARGMVLVEFADGSLFQFEPEFLYEQSEKRLPVLVDDED